MNLSFVTYFIIFALSSASMLKSEVLKSIEIKEFRNKHENVYPLNKSNKLRTRRQLRSNAVIDCFGVGENFSSALDWFLKDTANGTDAQKIKFYATSRSSPDQKTLKHGEEFNLDGVDFDAKRRTIFIVHGFLASGNDTWVNDMSTALLKWADVNVFAVDWSDGANTWNYYKAAVNTRTVGDQIATFIGQLINSTSNTIDPVEFGPLHLIGHSLGSHICGYAAQELKRRASEWEVYRITGLDPAQPCFKDSNDLLKLDSGDAPFVDIIHTNGRALTKLGLGLPNPIGHTDFYPNGGKIQPDCIVSESSIWSYLPLPIDTISETICSHGKAYLYFIDTVMSAIKKNCIFWARKWDLTSNGIDEIMETDCNSQNCIEMGINSEKYRRNGTFLTVTANSTPYCLIDDSTKEEVKDIIMETTKRKLNTNAHADLLEENLVH